MHIRIYGEYLRVLSFWQQLVVYLVVRSFDEDLLRKKDRVVSIFAIPSITQPRVAFEETNR